MLILHLTLKLSIKVNWIWASSCLEINFTEKIETNPQTDNLSTKYFPDMFRELNPFPHNTNQQQMTSKFWKCLFKYGNLLNKVMSKFLLVCYSCQKTSICEKRLTSSSHCISKDTRYSPITVDYDDVSEIMAQGLWYNLLYVKVSTMFEVYIWYDPFQLSTKQLCSLKRQYY